MSALRAIVLILAASLAGCASQRFEPYTPRPAQFAVPAATGDAFHSIESSFALSHGDSTSGFELLDSNKDGLTWRLALVDSATRSIDLQYYLWYGDTSGLLMIKHVLDAADRGVRVRILLDDLSTLLRDAATVRLRDQGAALLESHPNIEIRLFNPWRKRGLVARAGEAVAGMQRINQRMHHKQLIVDNRAAVIGGRNIGDEYFGLHEKFNFHDLDVLAIGPIAREASAVFDAFWNSEWVMPASALTDEPTKEAAEQARSRMLAHLKETPSLRDMPLEQRDWTAELEALVGRLHPGTAELFTDVPAAGGIAHEMTTAMYDLVSSASREVLIVNAYIIPSDRTIGEIRRLTEAGVDVRILTNSLASHDVPAVNSHYKQRRRDILEAGSRLHEMRPDAAIQASVSDTPPVRAQFMGLHSKGMVVDRERSYVGSMNFDPRSAAINTEMGIVITSPGLAEELASLIGRDMAPENSWEVVLTEAGQLRWVAGDEILDRQPARSWWQRVQDVFFMLFPKDWY